jgi:hypothetical protein
MVALWNVTHYNTRVNKTNTLTVRLEPEDRQKLDQLAHVLRARSAGEVVRQLLARLTLTPKLYQVICRVNGEESLTEDSVLVTQAELRSLHKDGCDLDFLIRAVAKRISDHVKANGFFMPPTPSSMGEAVRDLRGGLSKPVSLFLKSTFSSFWHAGSPSPASICSDPHELSKVLPYRMGVNRLGELWDITFETIRRALTVQRKTVSWFQPKHAFDLYKQLDHSRPVVWDPSGGFGARMIGFYAAYPAGIYFTNEPANLTFADLTRLAHGLGGGLFPHQQGSERGHPGIAHGSCDLVFTSPPYFDKEKYFDEPTQCWKNRTKHQWVAEYLRPTLAHARAYLKPEGYLKLNVDEQEPYFTAAEHEGFRHVKTEPWKVRRDQFANRKNKQTYNQEFLITWKKN